MSQARSESMRQRWADPEYKKKVSESISKAVKKAYENPEARKRTAEGIKKYFENPEARKRQSEALKKAYSDPEARKRLSEALKKAYENPELRKRNSEAIKKTYENPEARKRQSKSQKKAWSDPELRKRQSEAMKKAYSDPKNRKRMAEGIKKAWADPEVKKRNSEAIKKAYENPEVLAKICGPNSHRWKGGASTAPYCFNWPTISEFVRDRDLNRCALCWSRDHLNVHHVNFEKENCPPSNAVTLCARCHGRTVGFKGDQIRIASMEIFYPMLSDLYGYEYDENWTPLPEEKMRWPQKVRRMLLAERYMGRFEEALKKIRG